MARHSDAKVLRLGALAIVALLLLMASAFNLSKFPGFAGDSYHAELRDASGLHKGNMVQVAGIRVGRVTDLHLEGNKVLVDFEVDGDVAFGTRSRASVEVLNLLGEKYLELTPDGPGQLSGDDPIPVSRTSSAYDIVGVLGDLTNTEERINTARMGKSLETLAGTLDASAPQIRSTFTGISRLSQTVASRDTRIRSLLQRSHSVSRLLADRSHDLTTLMKSGQQIFAEIRARRQAIHSLLVNARTLAVSLRGVAADNQQQIGPALHQLGQVTSVLERHRQDLRDLLKAAGPYVSILGNVIGTGPWFDAYVPNLAAIPTGEFVPGPRGRS